MSGGLGGGAEEKSLGVDEGVFKKLENPSFFGIFCSKGLFPMFPMPPIIPIIPPRPPMPPIIPSPPILPIPPIPKPYIIPVSPPIPIPPMRALNPANFPPPNSASFILSWASFFSSSVGSLLSSSIILSRSKSSNLGMMSSLSKP